jgi:hypothetical protein
LRKIIEMVERFARIGVGAGKTLDVSALSPLLGYAEPAITKDRR